MSEAVKETPKRARPQYRNVSIVNLVSAYRLPLPGIVSILHRISGALLFLLLPFVLYLLQLSLLSETTFAVFKGVASHWFVKLILLALIWGYMQHFCAGVRHLFMDVHWALDKQASRRTAVAVIVVSLALTALCGLKLFGVF
jgi:succinate dehydrogenase / fumarate reductase cytochrome b subunit